MLKKHGAGLELDSPVYLIAHDYYIIQFLLERDSRPVLVGPALLCSCVTIKCMTLKL